MPRRVEDIRRPGRSIRDVPVERPPKPRESARGKTRESINKLEQPAPVSRTRTVRTRRTVKDVKEAPETPAPPTHLEEKEDVLREEIRAEIREGMKGNKSIPSNIPSTKVPINLPAERAKPKKAPSAQRKKTRAWAWISLCVILVIAGIGFVASLYFAEATFTIVPRMIPVAVEGTYVAAPWDASGSASSTNTLYYDIVTLRQGASTTVAATDGAVVSTKASGKVTLYNNFSTATQRLIAGTRLSDDAGHIYRISSSVVIPGLTGTLPNTIPGSVSASVVADQAGATYNLAKSSGGTLSIVAYKGTAKYDTMYAKLSTDIAGGYSGTKKTVSPSTLASTTASLKSALTESLTEQAKNALPADSIAYDASFIPSFAPADVSGGTSNSAVVTLAGTMRMIIFKKTNLISRIAGSQALAQFDSMNYTTPGMEALAMNIANPKDFDPAKKNTLIVHLSGNMKIVGDIPVDELKEKLAGVSLADTQKILDEYSPVIESGSGELIPPWAKVPTDLSHIAIKIAE